MGVMDKQTVDKSELEKLLSVLFLEFNQINKELGELLEKQKFANTQWYPQFTKQLEKWNMENLGERCSRDIIRDEIIEDLGRQKCIPDQQLDEIKVLFQAAENKRQEEMNKSIQQR